MTTTTDPASRLDAWSWLQSGFTAANAPFSFVYGGQPSTVGLSGWSHKSGSRALPDGRTEQVVTFTDPSTGLQVTVQAQVFADYPALEWVLSFKNTGNQDTPLIENIQALDTRWQRAQGGDFQLHRTLGSDCKADDFAPIDAVLEPGTKTTFSPLGGRSSQISAFPIYQIEAPGESVMVAIGWSGQWSSSLLRDDSTGLRITAGMAHTHLRLHPGEEIRSPRILLMHVPGDAAQGYNMLRHMLYAYHTPLIDGRPMLPLVQCNTWFPSGDDGNLANETNQIEIINAYKPLEIEYLVIDAGWFEGRWSQGVGNWTVSKEVYPNGLKPVADAAHAAGIKFGLWFEPERVARDTRLHREHPEWLLSADKRDWLLDLGLSAAQDWVIDMISDTIDEVGIDYFRHDFNIDPLPFWEKADAPDRQGMAEIRYIEGLYRIWDALRQRHPSLMIEGCASGGRRIDLESISRSHIYWKTDYYFDSEANQSHAHSLNRFLPANYLNTPMWAFTAYDLRSCLASSLCLGWDPRAEDFPVDQAKTLVDEFKALRHLTTGDYYPLLVYSLEPDAMIGYQFHRTDLQAGMAIVFRRPACVEDHVNVALNGLDPNMTYDVTIRDGDVTRRQTGKELQAGLTLAFGPAPSSVLVTYAAAKRP
ncbi:MAG: glycoside hydrolase family 36 protein [Anaerolineae bacterium]